MCIEELEEAEPKEHHFVEAQTMQDAKEEIDVAKEEQLSKKCS